MRALREASGVLNPPDIGAKGEPCRLCRQATATDQAPGGAWLCAKCCGATVKVGEHDLANEETNALLDDEFGII